MKALITLALLAIPFSTHAGLFGLSSQEVSDQLNATVDCQRSISAAFSVNQSDFTVVEDYKALGNALGSTVCKPIDPTHLNLMIAEANNNASRLAASESRSAEENSHQSALDAEKQYIDASNAALDDTINGVTGNHDANDQAKQAADENAKLCAKYKNCN